MYQRKLKTIIQIPSPKIVSYREDLIHIIDNNEKPDRLVSPKTLIFNYCRQPTF